MTEIWKNIDSCPGYKVSNTGKVKSIERKVWNGKVYGTHRERILKPRKNNNGYLQVVLSIKGKIKFMLVHRLVCDAFIPNPNNFPDVNHKDENPSNNNINNLEWCSRKYNINYGTRNERLAKKLSKKVKCIETGIVYPSTRDVERKLGFNHSNISKCCNKKYGSKTVGGLHFEWAE